jgi:hypothetical protein
MNKELDNYRVNKGTENHFVRQIRINRQYKARRKQDHSHRWLSRATATFHCWQIKIICVLIDNFCKMNFMHTCIPLTLYPRNGSRVLPKLLSYEKHCRRDRW